MLPLSATMKIMCDTKVVYYCHNVHYRHYMDKRNDVKTTTTWAQRAQTSADNSAATCAAH